MKVAFNDRLEALYAIDYCVNRSQNIIGQAMNSGENAFFDELYRTYLEKVSDVVRDDVVQLGDFHRKATYVFGRDNPLPDLTDINDFFERHRALREKIISDISNGPILPNLHLDALRSYFDIKMEHEINIVPSLFLNSAFGIFDGEVNIILGVNYNPTNDQYEISDRLISDIFYEFSRPYVQMTLYEKDIRVNNDTEYLVELITRVLETVFSTRIYGEQYIDTVLQSQEKMRLGPLRIYLSVYLENRTKILNLNDYISLLLEAGLAVQHQ